MSAHSLHLRLGAELDRRVDAFAAAIDEKNRSAAVRVLIATGLERLEEADGAYRAQAYREGVLAGIARFKSAVGSIAAEVEAELTAAAKKAARR